MQEDYKAAAKESEFATNERGYITLEGIVAYYERDGGLADDARSLSVGALDDFIIGSGFLTADLHLSPLGELEKVFEENVWIQWKAKIAAFVARFTKDAYLDYEVARLSEIFPASLVPSALREPGWLAKTVRSLQQRLADGKVGVIPELRRAVREYFGEASSYTTDIDYAKFLSSASHTAPAPNQTTGTEDTGSTAWAPLPALQPPEAEAESTPAENINLAPVGTLEEIKQLEREVDLLNGALQQNPTPQVRKDYEARLDMVSRRIELLSKNMEESLHTSTAYLLRTYDGIRELVDEVTYVGVGNKRFTIRGRLDRVPVVQLLPAGRGELHPYTAMLRDKEARVRARKKVPQHSCCELDDRYPGLTDEPCLWQAAISLYEAWKSRKAQTEAGKSSLSSPDRRNYGSFGKPRRFF
jgi:hypothetical protein